MITTNAIIKNKYFNFSFFVPYININKEIIKLEFFFNDLSILNNWQSLIFCVSLNLIFLMIWKFSLFYMSSSSFKMFVMMLSLFYWSMVLLIVSSSLFSLFLAWEGLGITSYLLILFYYNWNSIQSSNLTFISNRFGDSFMLIMLFLSESFLLLLVIFVMLLTKSAQVPFSSWLPAAMAAPTPVSALVHSSTLVTAGIILSMKYKLYEVMNVSKLMFLLGLLTAITGSASALNSMDIKKMVAFSTLSQLGFMVMSFYSSMVTFVLGHLLIHAFLKSLLFLMVGLNMMAMSSQQLTFSSSMFLKFKYGSMYLIIMINFSSFYLTSFYLSKEMNVLALTVMNLFLLFLLMTVLMMSLFYAIRFMMIISFKSNKMIKMLGYSDLGVAKIIVMTTIFMFTSLYYKNSSLLMIKPAIYFKVMTILFLLLVLTNHKWFCYVTMFSIYKFNTINNYFSNSMMHMYSDEMFSSLKYFLFKNFMLFNMNKLWLMIIVFLIMMNM
uniref:NADH:ubiquinone reductase (H(+)-translocating) n=1 Tax=Diximermis spiculatus TaxID=3313489 RepID=Q1HBB7_9BILA|nr:NADH dehydrogenase subunit 5 [Strelkovimermis spiculatus]ABF48164.1 NADH dehydrogenase subunit 5 [Strelkovimermis spiculatus]ABF48176.1 NADH dehydrogenase subunit 5 [Strelkovimermis spiculatus]